MSSNKIDAAILLLVKAGYSVTRTPHATQHTTAAPAPTPVDTFTPPLLDLGGEKSRTPHTCGTCGQEGHNARTCPKRPTTPAPTTSTTAVDALDVGALGFDFLPLPSAPPKPPTAAAPTAKPKASAPSAQPKATSAAPAPFVSLGDFGGFDLVISPPPSTPKATSAARTEASDTEIDALASELEGLDLPDSLL